MNPRDLPAVCTTVIGIDARAALPSSAASHWCGLGRAFIAVCLSLLVLAMGCSPEKSVEELLQDAQRYRVNREFAAAAIVLQNVLKRSPSDPNLYFELGRVRLEAGDLPGAEIALRKALELGTPQAQILPLLGTTLLQMERFQVVLDDVNPAPGLDPGVLADVAVARARAYLGLGNFVDARTAFLSAMAERPAEALLGIAHLALGQGEIAAAEKLLEDLAAKHPAHADLWVTQGNLLRIQRKSAEALKAYQRGAKEEPHNAAPYLSMALLHAGQGEFDRASAMLEQARKLRPWGPSLDFARAFVAFQQGKRQECEEALRRVVRVIPDHLPGRLLGAMVHHSRGALETARVEYLKYLRARPTDLNARKLLTRLLLQQAQPQSALNVILPVLEFVPDDPDLPALVGDAYMQLGELEQAAQQFERAAKLGPQDARLRARLGASRFALGQSEAAVADFRTALELKPGDVQAASLLVKALIARKELDPALEAANALEKKHPRSPLALATKATVLLARRDVPGARAQYQRALDVDPKYFPAAVVLARLDLRDQRPEAAQKRFESILKKDRNNLDATLALASLHLQLNRVDDALRVLHDAQVVHPDSAAVRLLLVQALLGARKLGAALETARKARELAPNDPRAMELLAEAQIASADYAAAAVTLAELVSTTPRSIAAKVKLAAALRANGEGSRAVGVLQKAVEQDPTRLDAMLALTTEYVREKRFAEALEMAARIRKQKPDAVETFVLEGDVLRQQGKLAAAESAYRRAHALRSTGSTLVKLHETLSLIAGRPVSDLSLIEWLSKRPDDVEVRLYLGWIYLEKRDWRAAADHYREVLKRYPDMPMALNNLALALQHLGDAQALAFARRAHQLRPNDGAVLDTLGLVLLGQGHPDEALERLQKAVSQAPEAPEIRYHLAMALLLHGDKAAAKRELEAAVASKKPFSERAEAEARLKELRR